MLNVVKPPNNRHLSGCAKADDRWSLHSTIDRWRLCRYVLKK